MKRSGFTVIELLVTISIMGIVLSIGVPSFEAITQNNAMSANSSDLITAFNYARMEAVKRGSSVELSYSGGDWTEGLVVWVDSNANDTCDSGEELRLWGALGTGTTLVSSNSVSTFTFSASGEVDHDADLTLCDDRTGETGRTISILASGVSYVETFTCE